MFAGRFSRRLSASWRQLWGQRPLSLEFNVTGFDRFEFKFRPKRSDFGRKKLRTAETAVGFRLSEVVLSPGRRGGKLGGLQQALRRTPVFYPYSWKMAYEGHFYYIYPTSILEVPRDAMQ